MFRQFKFEEALYPKLEGIPLSTSFKLDTIGVEFPLPVWGKLAFEERCVLCHMPIRSKGERECYAGYLAFLLKRHSAPVPPPSAPAKRVWEEISRIPAEVAHKAASLNLPIYWPEWIKLDDIERYAVYKLCCGNAEDRLLRQAVQELLGLADLSARAKG